ncbi:MAG: HNH endonuclease [Ruminococcus sp.]|nr:HNH endonuclease [Ruminococcus sp.]
MPLAKGGHPSAIENLQLAHRCCNRQKSDKLTEKIVFDTEIKLISNRVLPQTADWKNL